MTAHQYGTLKYIYEVNIHLKTEARELHMGTLGSLIKRGWIYYSSGILSLTDKGIQEYNKYKKPEANFRINEGEISEHVKNLLHINKLLTMRRAS